MELLLNNQDLFQQRCYSNGEWITAPKNIAVDNPATQKIIGNVPCLEKKAIKKTILAAEKAWLSWRTKPAIERAQLLYRWHQLILANSDDLALLLTYEQGKPLREAKEEIQYGAAFILWFAEEAKRIYGDIIPSKSLRQHLWVRKQAVGVVAAITPWNFPNAMVTRKAAPALAAGCSIIVKPSLKTPFSALALAILAEKAGLPSGVFNVITGDSVMIGKLFNTHPTIRKISFTGSTQTGKSIARQSALQLKKLSLELGGNAPFIVLAEANLEAALEGAIAAKFRNSGQTCVCVNRFYIHETLYDSFCEKLSQAVQRLEVGNGLVPTVQQGPLINQAALLRVQKHIADALSKGAQLLCGGKQPRMGGNFFEPTVLKNCSSEMQIAKEETFGPVAALFKFSTIQEVVKAANETEFGLAAYIYDDNINQLFHMIEQLDYGMLGINTGLISNEAAPFGGFKQSGIGREGSKYGIEDYLEIKYVCLQQVD